MAHVEKINFSVEGFNDGLTHRHIEPMSFPRRRESRLRLTRLSAQHWIPACAGMTTYLALATPDIREWLKPKKIPHSLTSFKGLSQMNMKRSKITWPYLVGMVGILFVAGVFPYHLMTFAYAEVVKLILSTFFVGYLWMLGLRMTAEPRSWQPPVILLVFTLTGAMMLLDYWTTGLIKVSFTLLCLGLLLWLPYKLINKLNELK